MGFGLREPFPEEVQRFVGRRDRLSTTLAAEMQGLEDSTASNEALDLYVCFDYGGRDELVEAARRLVRDHVAADEIDEEALRARLYEPRLPDPNLVIRSSGESRVSNFLLFQIAYAELVFSDALWPDFGREELASALAEYARRRRRFGGR